MKRGKWTFAHLPAIPSQFALKPIEKNENRLKTLLRLIKRKDVAELINACDAGREGELIFRYIAQFAEADEADPPALAAVDDDRRDPRGLRAAAHRCADAPARRRRRLPLRGRLARRDQRHARDDGVQLQVRRVPADDRRPRADAHARHPGRARGEDPRRSGRANYWEVHGTFRARAGEYVGPLVRREVGEERRRSRCPRRAPLGRGEGAPRSSRSAPASRESSPRKRSRRRRARRSCTTSRRCSARPTAASGFRRAPRCRSRRRSTKSTRRSPIRGRIRARCPRTISPPSRRRWRR